MTECLRLTGVTTLPICYDIANVIASDSEAISLLSAMNIFPHTDLSNPY
jgi:ABC-type Zn uptake system ZnuABC Zn-binding protein ZnuA